MWTYIVLVSFFLILTTSAPLPLSYQEHKRGCLHCLLTDIDDPVKCPEYNAAQRRQSSVPFNFGNFGNPESSSDGERAAKRGKFGSQSSPTWQPSGRPIYIGVPVSGVAPSTGVVTSKLSAYPSDTGYSPAQLEAQLLNTPLGQIIPNRSPYQHARVHNPAKRKDNRPVSDRCQTCYRKNSKAGTHWSDNKKRCPTSTFVCMACDPKAPICANCFAERHRRVGSNGKFERIKTYDDNNTPLYK